MSEQPYIGARVTLISSLDVRYEGTLFTIDPNESTVALQNVTCNGTEGRQSGSKAIPASDTVYEFIIFRGENIKSINIAESNKPRANNELNDPSILKLGPKGKRGPENRDTPSRPQPRRDYRQDSSRMQRVPRRDYRDGFRPNQYGGRRQNRGYRYNDAPRYSRRAPSRRDPRPQRRQDNNRGGDRTKRANPGDAKYLAVRDAPKEEGFAEDFDFEGATFSKEEALKQVPAPAETGAEAKEEIVAPKEEAPEAENAEKPADAKEANVSEDVPKQEPTEAEQDDKKEASPEPEREQLKYTYNKASSFFDDLDLVDKAHMDFKARRKIDAQTFGSEAENYKVRRRRRRGGRRKRNYRY